MAQPALGLPVPERKGMVSGKPPCGLISYLYSYLR